MKLMGENPVTHAHIVELSQEEFEGLERRIAAQKLKGEMVYDLLPLVRALEALAGLASEHSWLASLAGLYAAVTEVNASVPKA